MDFADPNLWLSLFTLTALEIVLGIDNLVFISVIAAKLPSMRRRASWAWRQRSACVSFCLPLSPGSSV